MVYNVSTSGLAALPRQVAQALDKQKALSAALIPHSGPFGPENS